MKKVAVLIGCALLQACATVGSTDRPASYYQERSVTTDDSLVKAAAIDLGDDKVGALLNYQIRLPEKSRIAILKLSRDNYWQFYSNDFTELNDSLVTSLVDTLRSSNRVYDASFLPAILVPETRTIPVLREAAARFQADLLLAYRSSCQSYQKYRFVDPNETKSYCSVEAVLLDTRSGVVAKSVFSTENFSAKKSTDDTSFQETVKKAELEAVAKALGKVANQVVAFLQSVPRLAKS